MPARQGYKPKPLPPNLPQRGYQRKITLWPEALDFLDEMSQGPGKRGDVVSALILAEQARREERQRLRGEQGR